MPNASLAELVALSDRIDRALDASFARLADALASHPSASLAIDPELLESIERDATRAASPALGSSFALRA